jgi:RNA polymerase-binding transcription factor DksA
MRTTNQTPKINDRHAWNDQDSGHTREELVEFATLLSRMREETREDIAALHHQAAVTDVGVPDQSLDSLIGRQVRHLRNIEQALHRISTGSFGRCMACGKPIARTRLLAVPVTRLCSVCKES